MIPEQNIAVAKEACQLKELVEVVIRKHPQSSVLKPDVVEFMSYTLVDDIIRRVNKYIAGQIEHGGKIGDRDLSLELRNEIVDLFWYNEANIMKGKG